MMNQNSISKGKKISLVKKINRKIFSLFRLNYRPVIKVYDGFGNSEKIIVLGHAFKLSPMPRKTYRQNWITNLFSVIRLFMVIPFSNAKISIEWEGSIFHARTDQDGFFRIEILPVSVPNGGWQSILVRLEEERYRLQNIQGHGRIHIPFASQHAFISDIDDTFLISHSSRLRRRLYVLLTKNARSRKPFEGVVNHYQLLARNCQKESDANPFFYVSNSEWNLYDFIVEFSRNNHLPGGVFLLSGLKRIKEFWKTGGDEHSTKYIRIVRLIEAYPHLQFVLLGDDSQQDPAIYSSLVSHFPEKIVAVYIRRVHRSNYERVLLIIEKIKASGVNCCYFEHSAEAIVHSRKIGLISSS